MSEKKQWCFICNPRFNEGFDRVAGGGRYITLDRCDKHKPEPTYTASQVQEMKNAWVEEVAGRVRDLPRLEREATDSEVSTPSRERVEGFLYAIEIALATIKEMKE